MFVNPLEFLFLVLVLKCSYSSQQSNRCTTVVVVTNAKLESTQPYVDPFESSPKECEQFCLFKKSTCKMASWNNKICSTYSEISGNISPVEDSEIYFISEVNSCNMSVCGNTANEWSPVESVVSLKRMALAPTDITNIVECANANILESGFVFDFSGPEKCFRITGAGNNRRTFSPQTYIYLKDPIFFSMCSVTPVTVSISTESPTYSVAYSSTLSPSPTYSVAYSSTLSPFQAQMLRWGYSPLVLRPAYIVLVGLGGACLLMTLVAVVALCQGKLGSGGRMSRKMDYSEESTEPVEVHNRAYDSHSKISEEEVDLTLPQHGEYFSETEVTD